MYCDYLEKLFLHNDFVEGRMLIEGKPIAPGNINMPVFAVGTEKDHVVPWKSAHKIHLMIPNSVTFALANSGHNAGIVSEPGHKGRYYRIHEKKVGDPYLNPDAWLEKAERKDESWWLAWENWIVQHSTKDRVKPPATGTVKAPYQPIADAPGTYVFQR
jgi:polyhydroxyalkanoate synthase